ncbi:MAG: SAM-dependent methyltransferase [Clostridia bacterium]|nr:SAM-dependent methyltransferase [Clostridia bacterium]
MELTPRLKCVYEMLQSGATVIDVGCDHGYLSVKLLEDGKYQSAFLADVNPGPLDAAKKNTAAAGLSGRCVFALSDGFKNIKVPEGDYSAAVCGMGGDLIARIVTKSEVSKGASLLVLQPMTKEDHLRAALWESGFEIALERAAVEGEKIYVAFLCRYTGEVREHGKTDNVTGERERREASPEMLMYLKKLTANRKEIVAALRGAGRDASKAEKEYKALLREAEYTASVLNDLEK